MRTPRLISLLLALHNPLHTLTPLTSSAEDLYSDFLHSIPEVSTHTSIHTHACTLSLLIVLRAICRVRCHHHFLNTVTAFFTKTTHITLVQSRRTRRGLQSKRLLERGIRDRFVSTTVPVVSSLSPCCLLFSLFLASTGMKNVYQSLQKQQLSTGMSVFP